MSITRCTRGFCWSSGKDMNSSTLREPELSRSSFLNLFPSRLISSASTERKHRETKREMLITDREKEWLKLTKFQRNSWRLSWQMFTDWWVWATHQDTRYLKSPSCAACRNHFTWQHDQPYLVSSSYWPLSFRVAGVSPHQSGWTLCYRTPRCSTLSPNTRSCDTSFSTNHSADRYESAVHGGGGGHIVLVTW